MTSFSSATLEKKLGDLSNTQHSVQTLSLWLIHHRKHAKAIVQAWYKELTKGESYVYCVEARVIVCPVQLIHRYVFESFLKM